MSNAGGGFTSAGAPQLKRALISRAIDKITRVNLINNVWNDDKVKNVSLNNYRYQFQIRRLLDSTIAKFTAQQMEDINPQVLRRWPAKKIAAISPDAVAGWGAEHIIFMRDRQLKALRLQQISKLSAPAINALTSRQLNVFSGDQISALTGDQVSNINPKTLHDLNSRKFARLNPDAIPKLTTDQIKQLTTKQIKALANKAAFFTADQLHAMTKKQITAITPAAIGQLSIVELKKLNPATIAKMSPEQIASIPGDKLAKLSKAQIAALTPRQVAAMSIEQLNSMGANIANIDPVAFAKIAPNKLRELDKSQLERITQAQISKMTTAQLNAIAQNKSGFKFSSLQINAITPKQAKGLTVETLKFIGDDIISLKPATLAAIPAAVLNEIDPDAIPKLTTDQIKQLTTKQIKALANKAAFFTADQLHAMTKKQITAITPAAIGQLSIVELKKLNPATIAKMSPEQIASIPGDKLAKLSKAQIAALTPRQVAAMSIEQLNSMGANIANIDPAAFAKISPYKLKMLNKQQLERVTPQQISKMTAAQLNAVAQNKQGFKFSSLQINAITPQQAKGLTAATIKFMGDDIISLKPKTVAAIPAAVLNDVDLTKLQPVQIMAMKSKQINGLLGDKIKELGDLSKLNNKCVKGLKPETLIKMMQNQLDTGKKDKNGKPILKDQLESMTDKQLSAIDSRGILGRRSSTIIDLQRRAAKGDKIAAVILERIAAAKAREAVRRRIAYEQRQRLAYAGLSALEKAANAVKGFKNSTRGKRISVKGRPLVGLKMSTKVNSVAEAGVLKNQEQSSKKKYTIASAIKLARSKIQYTNKKIKQIQEIAKKFRRDEQPQQNQSAQMQQPQQTSTRKQMYQKATIAASIAAAAAAVAQRNLQQFASGVAYAANYARNSETMNNASQQAQKRAAQIKSAIERNMPNMSKPIQNLVATASMQVPSLKSLDPKAAVQKIAQAMTAAPNPINGAKSLLAALQQASFKENLNSLREAAKAAQEVAKNSAVSIFGIPRNIVQSVLGSPTMQSDNSGSNVSKSSHPSHNKH